jgi:hypothetical protein
MTQNKLFRLRVPHPNAAELLARAVTPPNVQEMPCGEHRVLRRPDELSVEVRHNRHEEGLIGTIAAGFVIHSRLAAEFERRGFTGYRLTPATVRFEDGSVSSEYSQLVETGWAGVARPESGVRLLRKCPLCPCKEYSPLRDADQLVDWNQWSGDDFVVLWPVGRCLITQRVAEMLAALKASSHLSMDLKNLEGIEYGAPPNAWGFTGVPLSNLLPEDIAAKYEKFAEME